MDEEADRFRRIYEAHYGAVSAYARRRLPDGDLAQDAVSETFLVAWRRLADVPTGSDTLPWLYGVARRVLANQRRGNLRRAELSSRLAREWLPDLDVDAGVLFDDERRTVLSALVRLRAGDQEILRLAVWEELSHRQIGLVVGCSEATVAVRLHRARARLGKEIAKGQPRSGHDSRSENPLSNTERRPMTTERDRDVLERLRACNPVPAGRFDDLVWTDLAQARFQRIVATPASVRRSAAVGRRPGRPWRRSVGPAGGWPPGGSGGGAVSLSVAVAAYALVTRPTSKPQTVACFAAADLDGQHGGGGRRRRAARWRPAPSVWAGGFFGASAAAPVAGVPARVGRGRRVPRGAGTRRVPRPGPGRGVVAGAHAEPVGIRVAPTIRSSTTTGSSPSATRSCPGSSVRSASGAVAAEAIVREELDRAGLGGWTVTTAGRRGRGRVLRRAPVRQPQLPTRGRGRVDAGPRAPPAPAGPTDPATHRVWGSRSQ